MNSNPSESTGRPLIIRRRWGEARLNKQIQTCETKQRCRPRGCTPAYRELVSALDDAWSQAVNNKAYSSIGASLLPLQSIGASFVPPRRRTSPSLALFEQSTYVSTKEY